MLTLNFFIVLLFMQQNYDVIKIDNPHVSELMKQTVSIETCEFNSAKIHILKDGKYLIIPFQLGKYIILYKDRADLEKHIKQKYFPLPDTETESIYENENKNISNINENISIYISYVSNKFNMANATPYKKSVDSHLKILNKKITDYGLKKLTKYDILAIGLYVNEIFRKNTKTSWNVEKVLTLNPYWVPSLISDTGKKYDIVKYITKSINEYNIINLDVYYKMEIEDFNGKLPIGN